MPLYRLTWTLENGPGGEPSSITTQVTASTPDKAAAKAVGGIVSAEEVDGYTLTWAELNEDGDVVDHG